MEPKTPKDAFDQIRKIGKELGEKLEKDLAPVKEQMRRVGETVRQNLGLDPKVPKPSSTRIVADAKRSSPTSWDATCTNCRHACPVAPTEGLEVPCPNCGQPLTIRGID